MRTARALAVSLLGSWLFAGLAGAAAAQWVTFSASSGQAGVPGPGASPVRGYLSVPVAPGRHPALVMLPSCEGRKAYHQTWAQVLSERGYAALVVDDYFMHDRDQTCAVSDPAARAELLRMRLRHALGAARYLAARPEVDPARMAVMGWGDAPLGEVIGGGGGAPGPEVFAAAVAVTPASCDGPAGAASRPMLVLRAESQVSGPDASCAAPALEVRVYEGTVPGFDDPQADPAGETAPRRYNRLAHARAIEDVAAFLDRRLARAPSEGGHAYAGGAAPAVSEQGTWAVDPRVAGPDLPPAGGSAFDAVFSRATANGVVHDVPFPFPRLLQALERAAGAQSMSRSPLDATLIPLGRSLQREAAAPDYFLSPRIVVAVTGEPDSGAGPLGVRLKNRLFLGYQPRANVVEVISYNEAAARFEFQVVRDYGAGREPRVGYARRALCTSCHQNAGPIFPDASWDETTANAEVARRLEGLGAQFHGVPVAGVERAVTAIDIATGEANLLPVYQRLWSEGCAAERASEVARCRAGALQAMLQYRLSDSAGFDRTAALYAEGYLPVQRRNWQQRWPEGLLVPDANIPNRAPLMSPSPSVVPAALDPLGYRPPAARWQASSERDLERWVRGSSHALPDRDVALLDRYLRETREGASGRALTAPCTVIRRGFAGRPRLLQLECGTRPQPRAQFYLRAQLRVTPEGRAEGEAGWLEMDGAAYARRALAGQVEAGGSRIALRVLRRRGGAAVRAPDGNAITGFVLAWDEALPETTTRFDAAATLSIAGDFRPVASALARLAAGGGAASPLLADRFDARALSAWLLDALGVRAASQCCFRRPMPVARLDADSGPAQAALSVALEHRGPLLTFRRYCGACHGGDTDHPPGFLHGGADAVLGTLAQCAERIYYRLSMWHRAPEEQVVPPMPPIQGLSLAGTTAGGWRQSESLERLIGYARDRLIEAGRDPGAVLAGGYPATRACPASSAVQAGPSPRPGS